MTSDTFNLLCFLAICILKDREPGAFVIRDSNSFRGAYGLAMKVASPPPMVQQKKGNCMHHANHHCTELHPHLSFVLTLKLETSQMSWYDTS